MKTGIELIAEERQRQIEVEGWNESHDSEHSEGSLMGAAACYVVNALNKHREEGGVVHLKHKPFARVQVYREAESDFFVNNGDRGDRRLRKAGWHDAWPWDEEWDKRKKHDKIKSLQIAGALIAAELDRLQNKKLR